MLPAALLRAPGPPRPISTRSRFLPRPSLLLLEAKAEEAEAGGPRGRRSRRGRRGLRRRRRRRRLATLLLLLLLLPLPAPPPRQSTRAHSPLRRRDRRRAAPARAAAAAAAAEERKETKETKALKGGGGARLKSERGACGGRLRGAAGTSRGRCRGRRRRRRRRRPRGQSPDLLIFDDGREVMRGARGQRDREGIFFYLLFFVSQKRRPSPNSTPSATTFCSLLSFLYGIKFECGFPIALSITESELLLRGSRGIGCARSAERGARRRERRGREKKKIIRATSRLYLGPHRSKGTLVSLLFVVLSLSHLSPRFRVSVSLSRQPKSVA